MVPKYILYYKKEGSPLRPPKIIYFSVIYTKNGLILCIFSLQNTHFSYARVRCPPAIPARGPVAWALWTPRTSARPCAQSPHLTHSCSNPPCVFKRLCLGPWISSWPRALAMVNPALGMLRGWTLENGSLQVKNFKRFLKEPLKVLNYKAHVFVFCWRTIRGSIIEDKRGAYIMDPFSESS